MLFDRLTPSWLILLLQVFAMPHILFIFIFLPHILDEASVVVQSLSHVQLFATSWTADFPVLHCLMWFAQTYVH